MTHLSKVAAAAAVKRGIPNLIPVGVGVVADVAAGGLKASPVLIRAGRVMGDTVGQLVLPAAGAAIMIGDAVDAHEEGRLVNHVTSEGSSVLYHVAMAGGTAILIGVSAPIWMPFAAASFPVATTAFVEASAVGGFTFSTGYMAGFVGAVKSLGTAAGATTVVIGGLSSKATDTVVSRVVGGCTSEWNCATKDMFGGAGNMDEMTKITRSFRLIIVNEHGKMTKEIIFNTKTEVTVEEFKNQIKDFLNNVIQELFKNENKKNPSMNRSMSRFRSMNKTRK